VQLVEVTLVGALREEAAGTSTAHTLLASYDAERWHWCVKQQQH
jgi:hypothetical protein